jgi:3-oxoacyl-[acyl-carrier-protein] synthase III
MFKMRIVGVGSSIPQGFIASAEIEQRLGLEAGWIKRRTGILFRPIADDAIVTSDLATDAGERALRAACVKASDVGLLLLATSTPDHLLPPTAPLVAHHLSLTNAGAIDLTGACSGFLYGLSLGSSYGQAMQRPVLVIAANILSRRVNQSDPGTVTLFSDGAGAVVLVPDDQPHILGVHLGADGSSYDSILIPAGGTREPMTADSISAGRHFITMARGASVFRNASQKMVDAGIQAMHHANVRAQEIDWWIPHQANLRLIRETGDLLGIPMENTVTVIDRYANSSAATIPIALAEAVTAGRIQRGDLLLLTAVGAGMTNAGITLRW